MCDRMRSRFWKTSDEENWRENFRKRKNIGKRDLKKERKRENT